MDKKKGYVIVIFAVLCIVANFGGKLLAEAWGLPVWMDSVGTIFASYVIGPIGGAVIGGSSMIMYSIVTNTTLVYVFRTVAIGLIVGVCARKKMFEKPLSVFSMSMLVAVCAMLISTTINYFVKDGMTGNLWGDGVIHYLTEAGIWRGPAYMIGEFYVDLLDMVLALYFVFLVVKVKKAYDGMIPQSLMISLLITVLLSGTIASVGNSVYADEAEQNGKFNSYVQKIYNAGNGIPGGEVNAVAQTRDGMMWVGTYSGLYQYDGTKFNFMSNFDSVRNVNCLYCDEEGRLWIGTNDGGLSICANNEIVNILTEEEGLPTGSVRSICKSSTGKYYVGTSDSLVTVVLMNGVKIESIFPELKYVVSMAADEEGNVAVVTSKGELALINDDGTKTVYDSSETGAAYSAVYVDNNGFLYAGTADRVVEVFSMRGGKFKSKASLFCRELSSVNALEMTPDGYLFVCSDNGIGYFDEKNSFHMINTNDFNSSIDHIMVDYQGNYWFSSSRLGLLKLSPSIFEEIYNEVGMDEQVVNAVIHWDDCYYIGTDSGLDVVKDDFSREVTNNVLTQTLEGVRVRSFLEDDNGHLWIFTSGQGVYEAVPWKKPVNYTTEDGLLTNKTRTAIKLKDGSLAIATDNGVAFMKDGVITNVVGTEQGMETTRALCLLEKGEVIYVGTDGGGIEMIKNGVVVGRIKKKTGLGSDVILRMVECEDGSGMYVITSNGLLFYSFSGHIQTFDQFPYYNNFDLIENQDGTLWITSSAGIFIVNEENLRQNGTVDYELLDVKKGLHVNLTANSWNYKDENGTLFLCGDTGIVSVNMNDYDDFHSSFRIMLENIKVDGVLASVAKEDVNKISRNVVRLEFMPKVINYSVNDPYVSVWLEGMDEEPRIVLQSELENLVYTNLKSGEYTFHLSILDNRQENVLEEVSYRFVKENAFYDNWWFALYLFGIFAIVLVYVVWMIIGGQINKTLKIQQQELENLKLKQTADAALAATEAKDKFLALMSHDIRTPINAILGMNEMILRESNEQQVYDYAKDIKGAGNTLLSLVNSILDFSKIEEGKMEIIEVEYETATMLNNLINGVSARAREKDLEFRIEIDKNIPAELYGDDVRVSQVISNLLTNAVKYTERGFVQFTFREESRTEAKVKFYVEVKDSGIGIRKEDMQKLFESFQRLDEKRNRNIEGTGLGMSIVTSLLDMMNSHLDVQSEYGSGTTFSFRLEQKIVSAKPMGELRSSSSSLADRENTLCLQAPDAVIMVVDDNDMNLKVAAGLMKAYGIKPDTYTSGAQAIEAVKSKRYDMVFMDHMMPDMDGIEALRIMREENLLAEGTKAIILTANAINGAKEFYLKSGFDDYLSKPIDVSALEGKLKKYLPESLVFYATKAQIKENSKSEKSDKKTENVSENVNAASTADSSLEKLKKICPQIDTELGLKYCMDAEDFYIEIMKEYCRSSKIGNLTKFYDEKDWHNYQILAHSVKSSSMSIGAVDVSNAAKELEHAANENNAELIEAKHGDFIAMYELLLEQLKEFLDGEA